MEIEHEDSKGCPFTNHLIINTVLKFTNFDTLKNLRLVNKLLNQLSRPYFRQKAWIHINNLSIEAFLAFPKVEIEQEHESSVQDEALRSINLFCRNFHLKSLNLKVLNETEPVSIFFTKYGKYIQEIVLEKCIFTNSSINTQLLLTKYLPSCKVISIGSPITADDVESTSDEDQGHILTQQNLSVRSLEITTRLESRKILPWEVLFQLFPCLTSVSIQCRTAQDATDMLDALLNTNPQLIQLTEFSSFLTEFNEFHLNQLIHLNLSYTNLDLNFCPTVQYEKLNQLLKCCQKSLKILKLFHGSIPGSSGAKFPMDFQAGFPYSIQLNGLKSLELIGDMIESFSFLKFVPNLENLCILQHNAADDSNGDNDEIGILETDLVENSKDQALSHPRLRYLSMEYMLSYDCVKKLGSKFFPNLASISTYLNDNSIRAVFEYMPYLQELSILGTEITDEGITGISLKNLLSNTAGSFCDIEKTREWAYVGDCKELRKLSLYAQPQENVSDFSVYHGFMKMNSLTSLDLPVTSITDEGIQFMQTKQNLVQLSCKYFVEDGSVCKRPKQFQKGNN